MEGVWTDKKAVVLVCTKHSIVGNARDDGLCSVSSSTRRKTWHCIFQNSGQTVLVRFKSLVGYFQVCIGEAEDRLYMYQLVLESTLRELSNYSP